jgi:hypothetical protein
MRKTTIAQAGVGFADVTEGISSGRVDAVLAQAKVAVKMQDGTY